MNSLPIKCNKNSVKTNICVGAVCGVGYALFCNFSILFIDVNYKRDAE